MKIGVLGAGLMGREVAHDLTKSPNVQAVGLADVNKKLLEQIEQELSADHLTATQVDAKDEGQLVSFMKQYDVIVNALFYTFNETVAKLAIEHGVHSIDLGGHIGNWTDIVLNMNEKATKGNVTIIPDLGVAPGMINILSGYGVSKLDHVKSIRLYVGGIPVKPEPPLEYNQVFSMEGVFDHYTDPSFIIRDGKPQQIPSLSEIETIYFERFGPLEAFHTSGGTSTLSKSYPNLETLEYKTIRYPGHAKKFRLLIDLNLTKKDYAVEDAGRQVKPRDILLKVLDPIVDLGDKEDVVLLRVIVSGNKGGTEKSYVYEMITYRDQQTKATAMSQSAAYTMSVVAQMIGSGLISKRGVFPPEKIVPGEYYMKEMAKRGVNIKEKEI